MHLQFAQKAVIELDGRLLLVRKSITDPHQPGKWELPGGRLQDNESVDEALIREVHEEVGLDVEPGRPLAIWSWRMGDAADASTVVAVARFCTVSAGTICMDNHEDSDHIERWGWFSPDAVMQLDLIPSARGPIQAALAILRSA
jgi:8-oxo-dGTP pyrophosphatase MutT (NUDIX family)